MLVLSRKLQQEILIGDNVKITVLKVKGNTVRLGIEAPRDVHVVRGELPQFNDTSVDVPSEETTQDPVAEFTVVFSNSEESQSPRVDVIPFEVPAQADSRDDFAKPQSTSSDSATEGVTENTNSIRFRDRLPKPLQHNRLKEMVEQLTSKSQK